MDERMDGPEIRFKKVHPDALTPQYMTRGAAGFDLAPIEDIILRNERPALFSTGLVIAAPADHMLLITHRSSTPRKFGVTVMNGIVDQDFCGDDDVLHLQVRTIYDITKYRVVKIPAGTRIAQGIFVPITTEQFTEVEEMGKSRGGWGSTG